MMGGRRQERRAVGTASLSGKVGVPKQVGAEIAEYARVGQTLSRESSVPGGSSKGIQRRFGVTSHSVGISSVRRALRVEPGIVGTLISASLLRMAACSPGQCRSGWSQTHRS